MTRGALSRRSAHNARLRDPVRFQQKKLATDREKRAKLRTDKKNYNEFRQKNVKWQRDRHARNKAAGPYRCKLCGKSYGDEPLLERHCETKEHRNMLLALENQPKT